jgi:aspartate kinase
VLRPLLAKRVLPVVPGFIGRAPDDTVTTLGRGGSDLTATLLGRALGAEAVVLWKDVRGILTSDPRVVSDARLIPQLHHREAAEVAYYGAKVLHPRALIPLDGTRIVLHVRSFIDTTQPGTEVSARRSSPDHPVKAIAVVRQQAVVTVAGKGMAGVHGIAARTFTAVDAERLSVSTIFQASSESSIGFTLPENQAERAVQAIRATFRDELASGLIDNVTARPGMAVIAVVGDGMAGHPGIAARVFSSLASAGISVVAIAQGSSERNISFAVAEADAADAVRRVHTAFQLSKIGGGRRSRSRTPTWCCSVSDASAANWPTRSRIRTVGRSCASSACSIDRATCSIRAASRASGCSISRARRIAARCLRRSAATRPERAKR